MPISDRFRITKKASGPIWEWGKPFDITEKVTVAATVIATSASTFFDTPLDGTISAYTQITPMDITAIATSGVVIFDTPVTTNLLPNITMDATNIATTASVALV